MRPSEIKADKELKNLISGQVKSQDSKGELSDVAVYNDGERPTTKVPDDFIDVLYNGKTRAVDIPMNYIKGNLIVALYCKLNSNGTVKSNRVQKILEQFEMIVNRNVSEHYYYELNLDQLITPTTANMSAGYSITVLNVQWHTR